MYSHRRTLDLYSFIHKSLTSPQICYLNTDNILIHGQQKTNLTRKTAGIHFTIIKKDMDLKDWDTNSVFSTVFIWLGLNDKSLTVPLIHTQLA